MSDAMESARFIVGDFWFCSGVAPEVVPEVTIAGALPSLAVAAEVVGTWSLATGCSHCTLDVEPFRSPSLPVVDNIDLTSASE